MWTFIFGFLVGGAVLGGVGWHLGFDTGTERTNNEWVERSKKPRVPYPKIPGDFA